MKTTKKIIEVEIAQNMLTEHLDINGVHLYDTIDEAYRFIKSNIKDIKQAKLNGIQVV